MTEPKQHAAETRYLGKPLVAGGAWQDCGCALAATHRWRAVHAWLAVEIWNSACCMRSSV